MPLLLWSGRVASFIVPSFITDLFTGNSKTQEQEQKRLATNSIILIIALIIVFFALKRK